MAASTVWISLIRLIHKWPPGMIALKIWKNMAKLFIVPDKQFDRCQRKKDPQGLPVCLRGISVPVPNVLAIACSPMDSERRPFDRTI